MESAFSENTQLVRAGNPGSLQIQPAHNHTLRVSLCMIVRNEEANLPSCLELIRDIVDEVIVVDTGSTDKTKEVAASLGAKVFDFPWNDSFADARNESLRHATGKWIFWMDADDRIDRENIEKLRKLFSQLPDGNVAYLMKCMIVPEADSRDVIRMVDHTRLFRNHPSIRWHYRVHEQILPAIHSTGGEIHRADVVIRHIGYQESKAGPQKMERNLRLLQLENAEHPNDPFVLYNLGRSLERLGRTPEAIPCWKLSLQYAPGFETYVAKLYSLIAEGYNKLGRQNDVVATCLAGLARFPDNPELLFRTGSLLRKIGDAAAAAACFERLLTYSAQSYFHLGDDMEIRCKARTLLGRIYRDQQRAADAEKQWRAALEEQPDFPQALLGLGQLLLDQKRWDEFQGIVNKLEQQPNGMIEAAVLHALRFLANKEQDAARKLLEQAIEKHPGAIEPRILLSRILLAERKDLAAAERMLRAILQIDPGNVEAKRSLAKLFPIQGAS